VGGVLEGAFEYAVDVLKRLISIPSVAPDGSHYGEAAELLAGELKGLGFDVDVIEVPREYQRERCRGASSKPRYIVYGRLGRGKPRLHYNGHYDVVPGGHGWKVTDPFKPVIVEGKLYGRGAVDMKGGIAAVLGGLKALAESGEEPAMPIEVAFVPDEEIGGHCGTGYLVEEVLPEPPEYVVIPEPSGLEKAWHGHKGILWARVTVEGVNAHASTPWKGENAFLAAGRLALALQQAYTPVLATRKTSHPIDPPEAKYSTVMIGGEAGVPGGGKTNQVPGAFYFTVDRRLIPEETPEEALEELKSLLAYSAEAVGSKRYAVEVTTSMPAAANDPGELFQALRRAASEAGVEIESLVLCPGGLDLHYYINRGSKGLSYGPSGEKAHAPDEYISLDELRKLVHTFYALSTRKAWA